MVYSYGMQLFLVDAVGGQGAVQQNHVPQSHLGRSMVLDIVPAARLKAVPRHRAMMTD
jgi:hypothetical protein